MIPISQTAANHANAMLLVRVAERSYALPLASVERVLPMASVTQLPDASDALMGMLNLHGELLPVVDPRPRLGLASAQADTEHRLVLLNGDGRFLLWVDDVQEVLTPAADEVRDVPAQHSMAVAPRVLRRGQAIVPVLAPTALR